MKVFISHSYDPTYNLAIENYLFKDKQVKPPILFLWQNENTIVVGRNQNTFEQFNWDKVKEDHVTIVRRTTGGGTVYHDLGNINFSIILERTDDESVGFKKALKPILHVLQKLGVKAEFTGRNDLEVSGKKFSGNAKSVENGMVLIHGTLLFDSNISKIQDYLILNKLKIESKKIKSVSSRVTNIRPLLREDMSIKDMMQEIVDSYTDVEVETLDIDELDLDLIHKYQKDIFANDAWTFSKHADFSFKNSKYFEGKGLVEISLQIDNGKISNASITGDFMGHKGTTELEQKLIGTVFGTELVNKVIDAVDIAEVFGEEFTNEDIKQLFVL